MSVPIPRAGWAGRSVSFDAIGEVDQAYIHWTAGNVVGGAGASQAVEEKALRAWEEFHINSRGMRSIAYNVLHALSGRRYIGRGNGGISSTRVAGGHTACCNTSSVAACAMFGPGVAPSPALIAALRETLEDWRQVNVTTLDAKIGGHRDAPGAATACPGDALYGRLDELRGGDDDVGLDDAITGYNWARDNPGKEAPKDKGKHWMFGFRLRRQDEKGLAEPAGGGGLPAHRHGLEGVTGPAV